MPWAVTRLHPGAPGPWALTLFVCKRPRGIQPKAEIKTQSTQREKTPCPRFSSLGLT